MAAGDPIENITSVSGSSTATVTVPSGEVWCISSASFHWNASNAGALKRTDGTNTTPWNMTYQGAGTPSLRPIYDTHDVVLRNTACSSKNLGISGREI